MLLASQAFLWVVKGRNELPQHPMAEEENEQAEKKEKPSQAAAAAPMPAA